jgi:hypothetical protein
LILHTTVADIKGQYSKQEVARADLSREIARRLGYESDSGLARAVRDSSIHNLPITLTDITIAQDIYGTNIASLKGKSTKNRSINLPENRVNRHEEKLQTLILGIMSVNSEPYLITVSDPLNLTTVDHLLSIKGVRLHQDNQSTISLIENNKPTSQRTKHIDILYFFPRDRAETSPSSTHELKTWSLTSSPNRCKDINSTASEHLSSMNDQSTRSLYTLSIQNLRA